MGVPIHPGVSVADPEGVIVLPSLKGCHQLLVQTKQVALAVGAGSNETRHCSLSVTLHSIVCEHCSGSNAEQQDS